MSHFVYAFVTAEFRGARFVKMGMSCDPVARRRDVCVGCPIAIEHMVVMRCPDASFSRHAEAEMHHLFADRHSSGEWFIIEGEFEQALLAGMRAASSAAHFTGQPKFRKLEPITIKTRRRQATQATRHALSGRSLASLGRRKA